jgi:hypothetical protein
MSTSQIDTIILSVVGAKWKKVAMVIAKVADAMGKEAADGDRPQIIAERIETLARDGKLQVQGNIRNWRSSEVRRSE